MIIYTHKVRMGFEDGGGRSSGVSIEILGRYSTIEKAVEEKNKRDSCKMYTSHDIGDSWIDKEKVDD